MKLYGGGKIRTAKKKRETMKLVVWAVVLNAVLWVWASYILAYLGRAQIVVEVSTLAITEIIAVVLTYALKSLGEKHSLNKHGLRVPPDGSGKHYLNKPQCGEETTGGV
ncbi:MAG: hypothetical protein LBC78_05275 [Oscillospiraceae bacterium]|jgi:hypothetical protein|nr:hypothetical protein [Oscillospiraceae bacterium]